MKKQIELLNDMETLRKDDVGQPITATSAIIAINNTAKLMEKLHQTITVSKTHLKMKGSKSTS